jgi:hypothetical protein
VAIHPEMTLKILNMQLEDHGMPIQTWGQISNTVGVHNGDFIHILKKWTINTNNQNHVYKLWKQN